MKQKANTHKGYNESNPPHAKGAFQPESTKNDKPLAGKSKKEKPAVAEKKMRDKR